MPRYVVPVLVTIQARDRKWAAKKAKSLIASAPPSFLDEADAVRVEVDTEEIATEAAWKQRALTGEG